MAVSKKNTILTADTITRRTFAASLTLMGCSGTAFSSLMAQVPPIPPVAVPAPNAPARGGLLVKPAKLGELSTRSKIVLELEGELRLQSNDATKPETGRTAEVKGKSTLDYFENIVFVQSAAAAYSIPLAASRSYNEANVENWIAGSAASFKLRPECAQTRMLSHNSQFQQYCETTPLDAREVQLLHSPLNTAAVELLLPAEPAKLNSHWSISTGDAKLLFNLDAVHKSTLQAHITKVEKGIATMELAGDLEATANNVPTRLTLKGNFHARLGSSTAIITWLGLVIREERAVSQAEPGFKITARIRMLREETQAGVLEDANTLRRLATSEDPGRWLVRLQSYAGGFSMLADRRWHIHVDSGEEAILRMVEANSVIAQCSVSRLTELEAGQQLTLEALQADIRTSLDKGFGSFLESSEKVTPNKLRLMRCVVIGELEEVPIEWIYNHLSDDSGRRIAMIFTMGGNVTDRFAAADEQMSSSFEFLPEPKDSPSGPTAAPKRTAGKPSEQNQR